MAHLQFEIKGDLGNISVATFQNAIGYAFGILNDFDAAISGLRRGSLRWYISEFKAANGLLIGVDSRIKDTSKKKRLPDVGAPVARYFIEGFDDLENRVVTPPYLSEFGLVKAHEMVSLIGKNGAKGFRVSDPARSVDITEATSEHIKELLPIKRTAIGSIEGTLEKISVHKIPAFIVYHAISKRAVTCEFDPEVHMDKVKHALGQRVHVRGLLKKNFKGETMRIAVENFRVMSEVSFLKHTEPDFPEPEFTDAADSAEMLRRIRGG
jgi:hypothetical protein